MKEQLLLLTSGIGVVFQPENLALLLGGTFIGIIVGAIPGLSAITALACFLPLTFSMGPEQAIVLFLAVYVGANFGNAIPSVLLGLPGTPSAVMTAVEGYILQREGRGADALGTALFTSVAGQLVGGIVIAFLLIPAAAIAVNFMFPEVFAVALVALLATAGLLGGNPLLGIASAILGLMISTVGTDPMSAAGRFAYGNVYLSGGLDTVAVIVGLLIVGEIMHQLVDGAGGEGAPKRGSGEEGLDGSPATQSFVGLRGLSIFLGTWRATLVGYVCGLVIGVLPGVGGSVGSVVAYQQSKMFAREPEKYGHGSFEGLSAADGAGNVETAASAVPTFAFGIPGSPVMVITLAALTVHGITPGPGFMKSEPESVAALLATLVLAPFALLVVGLLSIRPSVFIAHLPTQPIRAIALVMSLIGIYAIHWSMFDVGVCLATGFVSFAMRRVDMPVLPASIAVLLGSIMEKNLRVGLSMTGSLEDFFLRPGVLILLALGALSMAFPYWRRSARRKTAEGTST